MVSRPLITEARQQRGDAAAFQTDSREMPAEHALLGLLKLAGGEAHGYDLARQFRRDAPLGDVFHLEHAMLYKHLKKLARLEWITTSMKDQSPRPPRQICRLTPAGEAELRRWLAEPVSRTREIRREFLVKLYFAWQLAPELASKLAGEQLAVSTRAAAALAQQIETSASEPREDHAPDASGTPFHNLVRELRLEQTVAAIAWLDQVAAVLREPDPPAPG